MRLPTNRRRIHPSTPASAPRSSPANPLGVFGELHPLVKQQFDFLGSAPVIAADLDLEALLAIADEPAPPGVPAFPPTLEDIAVVVDEEVPAGKVEALIRQTGGAAGRGAPVRCLPLGADWSGKKSLAYSLTYQASDRTLTDGEVAGVRQKIIKRLERELNATLRS